MSSSPRLAGEVVLGAPLGVVAADAGRGRCVGFPAASPPDSAEAIEPTVLLSHRSGVDCPEVACFFPGWHRMFKPIS